MSFASFDFILFLVTYFILISLLGYNSNEEPLISPNIKIENPMGIFGVYLSHFLIKLGIGYISFLLPLIGAIWGWYVFSKKSLGKLFRVTKFILILMFLVSFTIATFVNILFSLDYT